MLRAIVFKSFFWTSSLFHHQILHKTNERFFAEKKNTFVLLGSSMMILVLSSLEVENENHTQIYKRKSLIKIEFFDFCIASL